MGQDVRFMCILLVWGFMGLMTSGCGSFIFNGGPTTALLMVHQENFPSFPSHIGLLEEQTPENVPIILSVPPKEVNNDPKTVFWESPLLKTQEWADLAYKGMKRGGRLGGNIGFTVGRMACLPMMVVGHCNCEEAVPFMLLCGGGIIGGTGVGWVMGGAIGSLSYFLEEETVRNNFELFQQDVVQSIWKQLMKIGGRYRSEPLQKMIDKNTINSPRETFSFGQEFNGLEKKAFNGFLRIVPLHLQLVQEPYKGSEELMLSMRVKWTLLDIHQTSLMEEELQVEYGPYNYEEWSDADGWLLKSNLDHAYSEIAEHIVSDFQMRPHTFPDKLTISSEVFQEKESSEFHSGQ